MGSRRNEPGPEDPWSVLGSEAARAREVAEAEVKIQQILDKHRTGAIASAPETADTPEIVPVVIAPTPPPDPREARKRLAEIFTNPEEARSGAGEWIESSLPDKDKD